MRVLFVGDVVGDIGVQAIATYLPPLKKSYHPQVTIVNGENAAQGRGIKAPQFKALLHAGADIITLGNHAWDKYEVQALLQQNDNLLRPANYPGEQTPGQGMVIKRVNEQQLAVINLQGRSLMNPLDDPFRTVDRLLAQIPATANVLIDFHAETTSEKTAFAYYVDGRVGAVLGTHTHVQTNDARILPKGTAFVTDVGMTGSYDGVLGVKVANSIQRFVTQRPTKYEVDDQGRPQINYCLLDLAAHNQIQVGQINSDHPFTN